MGVDLVFKLSQNEVMITWNKGLTSKQDSRILAGKKHPSWGGHHSNETKRKISLALTGVPHKGKFKKGHKSFITDEVKRKMSEAQKGREHSEETKAKIRRARIKQVMRPHSEETKRKIAETSMGSKYNLGRKVSEETKEKISKGTRLKNNPNWKGGKSFEPYTIEFNNKLKEKIRKRDDYVCQECGRHQDELFRLLRGKQQHYKLLVHHIDYNKENNQEDNLISLCLSCHTKTNFKRDDWTKHYKAKLKNMEVNYGNII